jgi:hypothetical protein
MNVKNGIIDKEAIKGLPRATSIEKLPPIGGASSRRPSQRKINGNSDEQTSYYAQYVMKQLPPKHSVKARSTTDMSFGLVSNPKPLQKQIPNTTTNKSSTNLKKMSQLKAVALPLPPVKPLPKWTSSTKLPSDGYSKLAEKLDQFLYHRMLLPLINDRHAFQNDIRRDSKDE